MNVHERYPNMPLYIIKGGETFLGVVNAETGNISAGEPISKKEILARTVILTNEDKKDCVENILKQEIFKKAPR